MAAVGSEDWSYIYVSGGFETDGIDRMQRYDIQNDRWDNVLTLK